MNKIFIIVIVIIAVAGGVWLYRTLGGQQNTMDDLNQNTPLLLDFSVGGGITGSSFKVHMADERVTYQEFKPYKTDPVNTIEKSLSPAELANIVKTIADADIINLPSQDFKIEPPIPDHGLYRISLTRGGQTNEAKCTISPPLSPQPKTKKCQNGMTALRDKLNSMLGVTMY